MELFKRNIPEVFVASLLILVACNPTKATQFYSCPHVTEDTVGTCVEECSSDSDCADSNLCCSNGCGHICTTPITIPYHAPSLVCPEVPEDTVGICLEDCDNCSKEELCCSNGCGHTCTRGVAPTPLCGSIRSEILNSSLIGAYLPQCDEVDGSFTPIQCHPSTGYCWCVRAETGEPVSDVVQFRMPQCNCSYNGHSFQAGETFDSAEPGICGTCSCTVDGGVSCTQMECPELEHNVFYSCPAVRKGSSTDCDIECLVHSECTSPFKCCYNGCANSCVQPHRIPYIDISTASSKGCPGTSDVPCAKTQGSCRDEGFNCGEDEVCCDNDCSSAVCIPKEDSTPCFAAVNVALSAASNSSNGRLGAYRPLCTTEGYFREIQCHSHYCWCVESLTGRPTTDIVPFEQLNTLSCAVCIYNGVQYSHLERFSSGDGCNLCSCNGGTISCSSRDCDDDDDDDEDSDSDDEVDDELWQWWHSVLIVCVVIVVVLVSIFLLLLAGIAILMKQNNIHRHYRLKEDTSEQECEMVEYRNGHEPVELKVPMEDTDLINA